MFGQLWKVGAFGNNAACLGSNGQGVVWGGLGTARWGWAVLDRTAWWGSLRLDTGRFGSTGKEGPGKDGAVWYGSSDAAGFGPEWPVVVWVGLVRQQWIGREWFAMKGVVWLGRQQRSGAQRSGAVRRGWLSRGVAAKARPDEVGRGWFGSAVPVRKGAARKGSARMVGQQRQGSGRLVAAWFGSNGWFGMVRMDWMDRSGKAVTPT
jgi:hypothetical protein